MMDYMDIDDIDQLQIIIDNEHHRKKRRKDIWDDQLNFYQWMQFTILLIMKERKKLKLKFALIDCLCSPSSEIRCMEFWFLKRGVF